MGSITDGYRGRMARGKKSTHVDGQGSLFDLLDMEPDAPQLTPGEDELDAEANEPDSGLRTAVRPEPVRGDSGPGDGPLPLMLDTR